MSAPTSTPEEFLCPITLTVMKDPVIGPDGHSYERSAIVQWLQTNPHSPLTRQPMTVQMLQTNYGLRTAIERYSRETVKRTPRAPKPTTAKPKPTPKASHALPSAPYLPTGIPLSPPPTVIPMFSQELQQPLLVPAPYAPPTNTALTPEARRRQKILGACVCFTILVIFIIIISRLYEGMEN
jgi:hypothetical protein